ncbi:hypothetical protein NUACC26_061850 [Scytonema sp. NUACC26]
MNSYTRSNLSKLKGRQQLRPPTPLPFFLALAQATDLSKLPESERLINRKLLHCVGKRLRHAYPAPLSVPKG